MVAYYRKRGPISVHGAGTRWYWTLDAALVPGGCPLGVEGKATSKRAAWAAGRDAVEYFRERRDILAHLGAPWKWRD